MTYLDKDILEQYGTDKEKRIADKLYRDYNITITPDLAETIANLK